eukprot:366155-Chlamydomonas_euryale.AAC.12
MGAVVGVGVGAVVGVGVGVGVAGGPCIVCISSVSRYIGRPQAEQKMDVHHTFVLPIFSYGCETWTWMQVQMGRLEVTHSNCLICIVCLKLTASHRLEHHALDSSRRMSCRHARHGSHTCNAPWAHGHVLSCATRQPHTRKAPWARQRGTLPALPKGVRVGEQCAGWLRAAVAHRMWVEMTERRELYTRDNHALDGRDLTQPVVCVTWCHGKMGKATQGAHEGATRAIAPINPNHPNVLEMLGHADVARCMIWKHRNRGGVHLKVPMPSPPLLSLITSHFA